MFNLKSIIRDNAKDKILKEIQKMCNDYESEIAYLRKENEKLRSGEAYKELEKRLEEKNRMTINELSSEKELIRYKDYCKKYGDSNVFVRQVGTGIGVCTYLSHNDKDGCYNGGEETDITDIEVW